MRKHSGKIQSMVPALKVLKIKEWDYQTYFCHSSPYLYIHTLLLQSSMYNNRILCNVYVALTKDVFSSKATLNLS